MDVATGRTTILNTPAGDERAPFPRFTRDGRAVPLVRDRGREFMNPANRPLPEARLTFILDQAHDGQGF